MGLIDGTEIFNFFGRLKCFECRRTGFRWFMAAVTFCLFVPYVLYVAENKRFTKNKPPRTYIPTYQNTEYQI
jgi:hypothetical protein